MKIYSAIYYKIEDDILDHLRTAVSNMVDIHAQYNVWSRTALLAHIRSDILHGIEQAPAWRDSTNYE